MVENSKRLLWGRLAVILAITYAITIGVYFIWFYNPIKSISSNVHISEIKTANQIIKSMNHDHKVFFFIISFLACLIISMIILRIYEEIILYNEPVTEVNARLKSKELYTRISGGSRIGTTIVSNSYKLTFEVDNDAEMSFYVKHKHYFIILEGNKGVLKYKEGRINRYMGFEIIEIE